MLAILQAKILTLANSVVNKVNDVIDFVNENSFFSSISNIPVSIVNQDNPIETILEDENFFNKINFSIEDNNVDINNVGFVDGNLTLTASIVDPSVVNDFIETTLNFTYEDEFNRLTGSYPVKIYLENQNSNWYVGEFNLNSTDVYPFKCPAQEGTEVKFYVNLINSNDDFSGMIYFREAGTVVGIEDRDINIVPFSEPLPNGNIISSSEYEEGNSGNDGVPPCYHNLTFHNITFRIQMNPDGNNIQFAYILHIRGNQFTECQNPPPYEECYLDVEVYADGWVSATYLGTESPSDL